MDYTWIDASRKRVKLPAPQYIDYVLTWVEGLIKDESVFPTKAGREFSPNFPSVARHIYTQLLRIFAHLYHAHYPIFLHLSSEGHLNSLFAHFLTFGREFDLLEEKETRAPKEGWPFVVGDLMDVSGEVLSIALGSSCHQGMPPATRADLVPLRGPATGN